MTIHLYLTSKNLKTLKTFSNILFNICIKTHLHSIKSYPLHKKNSLMSLLKSPHVNKIAQEQFKFNIFNRKVVLHTHHSLKLLLILKHLGSKLFPDLKIKVLMLLNKNKNILNPVVSPYLKSSHNIKQLIYLRLNRLDVIGEQYF